MGPSDNRNSKLDARQSLFNISLFRKSNRRVDAGGSMARTSSRNFPRRCPTTRMPAVPGAAEPRCYRARDHQRDCRT